MALKRPKTEETRALYARIMELEAISTPTPEQRAELKGLAETLEVLLRRQRMIPYIDPLDVRYNYFQERPEPNANAVMFCLMDVSASMGEREKDLAKRFFVLLHLFLGRRYDKIDVVFVRHTHNAKEVDEETFFYSRESGGPILSRLRSWTRTCGLSQFRARCVSFLWAQSRTGFPTCGRCAGLWRIAPATG